MGRKAESLRVEVGGQHVYEGRNLRKGEGAACTDLLKGGGGESKGWGREGGRDAP